MRTQVHGYCKLVLQSQRTEKSEYHSLGGGVIYIYFIYAFIKSSLSSIHTYYSSLLQALVRVTKKLERLQQKFLWTRHMVLARFTQLIGRSLQLYQRWVVQGYKISRCLIELLGKWLWRFGLEENALWREVVIEKYGTLEGRWRTRDVTVSFGCSMWRSIIKGWNDFNSLITSRAGGKNQFWNRKWYGENPLRVSFPNMRRISNRWGSIIYQITKKHEREVVWTLLLGETYKIGGWTCSKGYWSCSSSKSGTTFVILGDGT